MKLTTESLVGFTLGAIIAVSAVLFFMPAKKDPFYSSGKIDGNTLKTLYNADFSKLILNFKYNSTTVGFDLVPTAMNRAGASIEVDRRLLSVLSTGKNIAGDRDLVTLKLEHNSISGYLQLKTLVELVDRNPGCYFMLNASDYIDVDASDKTHIYYKIVAYSSADRVIDVSTIDSRAFQLNPSPPGRYY